jgi:hypothetical protein
VIEMAQIDAGLEMATVCLELVLELGLSPMKQGNAHWLVGSLDLAAGRFAKALVAFERAAMAYRPAQEPAYVLPAQGYGAIARKAVPASRTQGAHQLSQVLRQLRTDGSKNAAFFAEQLVTAERLLLR